MVKQALTKPCEHCGKVFAQTPTMTRWDLRRFCSRACTGAARRTHPATTTCQSCGRDFPTPSGRRPNLQFCSLVCSGKGRTGRRTQDPDDYGRHLARKLFPEHRPCERCGIGYFEGFVARHHRNSDRSDNRAENIEFLCRACHAAAHGASDGQTGGGTRERVVQQQKVAAAGRAAMARELLAQGMTHGDVARTMGFDQSSVRRWLRKYSAA